MTEATETEVRETVKTFRTFLEELIGLARELRQALADEMAGKGKR